MSCAACTALDVIFTDFSEIYHTTASQRAEVFWIFISFLDTAATRLGSLRWISSTDLELFHSTLLS